MKTIFCLGIACFLSLSLGAWHAPNHSEYGPVAVQDQDDEQGGKKRNIRETVRQVFMRGKLDSNKKIVEGLATNDFSKIEQGAAEIEALVKGQHWFVLDTDEYKEYSQGMQSAASRLKKAAQKKNMDAAALRYFGMTMNCLDCHRYIESRRH